MAPDRQNEQQAEPPAKNWRERIVARARGLLASAKARPLRALLAATALLVPTTLLLAAVWFFALRPNPHHTEKMLQAALEKLDAGQHRQARDMAAKLLGSDDLKHDELGVPSYVLGAALAQAAESHWDSAERQTLYSIAARYLEEARDRRFPPGREGQGLYLLGKSLYESGRYAQSLAPLLEAAEANTQHRSEIYRMLASAYRRDADPQFEKARSFLSKHLEDRMLAPDQRHAALLELAGIHFDQGDSAACRQALDSLPPEAQNRSLAIVLRGRLLMREGDQLLQEAGASPENAQQFNQQAVEKYNQAIQALQLAQARDTSANRATPQAIYLQALCRKKLADRKTALKLLVIVRRTAPDTDESLASALAEAELLYELGQLDDSFLLYERLLKQAPPPAEYSNAWVPLSAFRSRLTAAYARRSDDGHFESAVKLTRLLASHFEDDATLLMRGETYELWAQRRYEQAGGRSTLDAEALRAESRLQRRQAGRVYQRLARLWVARREYPDLLWRSAENYLIGRDYDRAVDILNEYLQNEARSKRPRALVAMGEAQLALGNTDEALAPLLICIEEHPRDPQCYQARLIASRAYLEKGLVEEAKAPLLANLENEELTPDSAEWRDSLFALGAVQFREGLLHEAKSRELFLQANDQAIAKAGLRELEQGSNAFRLAIRRFSEAVQRYPRAVQTVEAHYKIAEAYRRAAKFPARRAATSTIETTRSEQQKQVDSDIDAAVDSYSRLLASLDARLESESLSPSEQAILRNCFFNRADAFFTAGRYEDAINAYSLATTRYQTEPAALEAYVQIAACHRQLGRRSAAKGALLQAKLVLQRRIPPDADFTKTTSLRRDEWIDRLNWLSSL